MKIKKKFENVFNSKIFMCFIALFFVLTISIGYSAFSSRLFISGDVAVRVSAPIRVSGFKLLEATGDAIDLYYPRYSKYTTSVSAQLPNQSSSLLYEVKITNYSSDTYQLDSLKILDNTNDTINFDIIGISEDDIIAGNSTVAFQIRLYYVETKGNNDVKNLKIQYNLIPYTSPAPFVPNVLLSDRILSDNGGTSFISSKTNPNFSNKSLVKDGMYSATDNDGTTYYFRGTSPNNFVSFGGYLWRIIRINGDRSIRLIYYGTGANDTTNHIGNGAFSSTAANDTYQYLSNWQYTYNSGGSAIKLAMESWFANNLQNNYRYYLNRDTGFCNDFSTASGSYNAGSYGNNITFTPKIRLDNGSPSFMCGNAYYMTVSDSVVGTKNLAYPIGAISLDEAIYAGGGSAHNTRYYLYTGKAFWTMSPNYINGSSANYVTSVNSLGAIGPSAYNTSIGYRPVVNLDEYILHDGGTGYITDPYKVKLNSFVLTVTPSPSNATVTIKNGSQVLANGTGTQNVKVVSGTTLSYNVVANGYIKQSESVEVTRNRTLNVNLQQAPLIDGTHTTSDRKTAYTATETIYHSGYYLIDLFGARGGDQRFTNKNNSGYGGASGHVYALCNFPYESQIYYTIGGTGDNDSLSQPDGGANGGGAVNGVFAGSAGGYSAVAINANSINQNTINSGNVLLIAGGGGGGASNSTSLATRKTGDGGAGGNMNSPSTTISTGIVFNGANGGTGEGTSTTWGVAGQHIKVSNNSKAGHDGNFLSGGAGRQKGGGGGGGYYGGGGGGAGGTSKSDGSGGGGGGSSYISNACIYNNLPSSITSRVVSSNPGANGYIKITYIGETY